MKQLVKLNSARSCLRYLVKVYNIKSINMPYYICPSVKKVLREDGVNINFYHIDKNFMPNVDFSSDDFILYPNYFGICGKNIDLLEKKYKNLIVDNAHAFYAKPAGLASFNSLRKFFQIKYGIMDGAYLFTEKILNENFERGKNYEPEYNISYEKLVKNEHRVDSEPILFISETTENLINTINFEQEKLTRLNNFRYFDKIYGNSNKLKISLVKVDYPFVYPYYSESEDVGYELAKQGKMVFRYWEGLPSTFEEYKFYRYLVPIPLY